MPRSLAFYVDVLGFHKDFGNDDFAGLSREGNPATQAFKAPLFCAPR